MGLYNRQWNFMCCKIFLGKQDKKLPWCNIDPKDDIIITLISDQDMLYMLYMHHWFKFLNHI